MCSSKVLKGLFLALGVSVAAQSLAEFSEVEFSAEMRQTGPQGSTTGMMYVGKDRMRMEMEQGGQKIVQIMDAKKNVQWLLYPDQHSYIEHQGAPAEMSGMEESSGSDPCAGAPGATCKNLGIEEVGGRKAVKWEMTVSQEGKSYTSTQWLDVERNMPLRTRMPDGSGSELKMLGTETVNGRNVEKWEMVVTRPGKAPETSYQWYDPRLKIIVREEFPGGYVRELANIQEGQLSSQLFDIPAGYKRISMPANDQYRPSGR